MSSLSSTVWQPGSAPRRPADGNPDLRLSDADRGAAGDRLSTHYGEGRLDQSEFDERLDRVLTAKVASDLDGVFAGLPADVPTAITPVAPPRRRPRPLLLVLVVLIAAAVGPTLLHPNIGWLLIGLLVFLWVRHRRGGRF